MAKVEIYTIPTCPYCAMAKNLLDKKNIAYEETNVEASPEIRQLMTERANGKRTVPQVFINNAHVGGCDELYALDLDGGLDSLN